MPTKKLVKATEYKVKDDDTLESIAKAHSLTVKQLMRFNWGTDKIGKNNVLLRDKLGSRKLDKDKNYILSKDDDPGIIFIPEVPATPQTFATNGKHSLTVKLPVKKVYKTAKCMVSFRPDAAWKGEYGFDWMRDGDWGNGNNYLDNSVLTGGYKFLSSAGMSTADALKKLKKEFAQLKPPLASKPDYYAPYLNIFPSGLPQITGGDVCPTSKLKLKLAIKVEEEAADSLIVKLPVYKKDDGAEACYFSLKSGSLELPKAVGDHTATIELECTHEMESQQEISVIAATREPDGSYKEYEAGKIIVLPNVKKKQKEVKIVFVQMVSDVLDTGTPNTGVFDPAETGKMIHALFQTLSIPSNNLVATKLDVSNKADYKITTADDGTSVVGKHCVELSPTVRGMQHSRAMHQDLKALYEKEVAKVTKEDFLIFSFEEFTPWGLTGAWFGFAEDIKVKNVVLFERLWYTNAILGHEVLHGLGLRHYFKDDPANVLKGSTFTFKQGNTDNVMDYSNDRSNAVYVNHWQWKIVNPA